MSYTASQPHDLGFLSNYVVNTSGSLTSGAADSSTLTPSDFVHYYDFDYAGGLISVTITLSIESAQILPPQGEIFSGEVVPKVNLSGSSFGLINWGGSITSVSTGGNYIQGTTTSAVFTVTAANPGRAVFEVDGGGILDDANGNGTDVNMTYQVFVDIKQETPTSESYTGKSGNFQDPGNWPSGTVPGSNTNVTIGAPNGSTSGAVNSTTNVQVGSLGINGPWSLNVNSGTFAVGGTTTNGGTLQAGSGGQLALNGGLQNNGSVSANTGGTVYAANSIGGIGLLKVNGGNFEIAGSDTAPVQFGSTGLLTLDAPAAFAGSINFASQPVNDVIDLRGTAVSRVYASGPSLSVTTNQKVLTFQLTNLGYSFVTATSDGSGGTDLVVGPGVPTAMVMRNGNTGALELYALGNNTILGAASLGQVGLEWQIAGFGDFSGLAGEADMLMRNRNTGAFEVYDIRNNALAGAAAMGQVGLEWQVAGFGDFSTRAGETDMMMRNSNTGAFELYDISNNAITGASAIGGVGVEWKVAGFGDFSGRANETDMLLRNGNTGAFEVYDIANNRLTSAASMGQVGLEWQVAGFGNFSGNASETDMMLRNGSTGAFEVYDIASNQITGAASMGQVGLEWQVVGFSAFGLNPGEGDMLLRNRNTGALEVYDIYNNQITGAASMGQVGLEWQVGGLAVAPSSGPLSASTAQLAQAMASFGTGATDAATPPTITAGADPSQQTLLASP